MPRSLRIGSHPLTRFPHSPQYQSVSAKHTKLVALMRPRVTWAMLEMVLEANGETVADLGNLSSSMAEVV